MGPLVRADANRAGILYGRGRRIDSLTSHRIEHPVSKLRKNRIREERIHNEAIVDAYGPEEQALGWYYYLENKIQFP
ncbi:MAG: calcium-binding protein, partial [Candidatus Korobacteraceae bacterium]